MLKKIVLGCFLAGMLFNMALGQSNPAPNYHDLANWAAHPWKWDPSDSVPAPLRAQHFKDSVVDVFFVHPTTFTASSDTASNARLDDAGLNERTDELSMLNEASAFNEQTRVFAPRYRQAHYRN